MTENGEGIALVRLTRITAAALDALAAIAAHQLEQRTIVQRLDAEIRLRRIAESQRARAVREACTDALTGLRNRRALERDLDALEAASAGVLAVLDVDDLKLLNDAHGHAIGDRYLCALAGELRACVRKTDYAYRTGGDEFVLLVRGAGAAAVRSGLERALERLRCNGYPHAAASIGIAAFSAQTIGARRALEAADLLMYAQKRTKRRGAVAPSA